MTTYSVEQLDDVVIGTGSPIADMELMSPYVWREGDRYRLMVRTVPPSHLATDLTGVICSGESADGLHFEMELKPAIVPGPDAFDAGGCEDPTVLIGEAGGYSVFYTGVDAARAQGSLLVAKGPDLVHLKKEKVMLRAPAGEGNIKEATLAQTPSGSWRLFYEYAAHDASRIGMATGPSPDGPWTIVPNPFGIREDSWDNWHLSTGPIAVIEGRDPVMFYNGATADARWRIGWVSFDPEYTRVTDRGLEPLLVPPPAIDRAATDIAFAASCIVEDDQISLYYSLEDRRLCRARVQVYDSAGRESSKPGEQPKAPADAAMSPGRA